MKLPCVFELCEDRLGQVRTEKRIFDQKDQKKAHRNKKVENRKKEVRRQGHKENKA